MPRAVSIASRFVVSLILLIAFSTTASAQNKDKNEDVKGARWEYEIYDGEELLVKGHFRVNDKKLFHGTENIGHVEVISSSETKLVIKDLPIKKKDLKLSGTAQLKKVDTKPPEGSGKFVTKDGNKYRMKVIMKDR